MEILGHTIEPIHDPTGILPGERFDVFLDIRVPEEDEMYRPEGLTIKLIYAIVEGKGRIVQYQIYDAVSEKYLDFALDEEELKEVDGYVSRVLGSGGA
jgi:hypothetical protein